MTHLSDAYSWHTTRDAKPAVDSTASVEEVPVAYVVCEPCHDCKYTDCVVVCPCDCFYQDETQLYIDPVDCVDCDACVPECPVEAIFHETNVPAQWARYTQLNADKVSALKGIGGNITQRQEPLAGPTCRGRATR